MKKIVMKLAIKMAFGKLTPLPWHIEPIVKELITCACIIGVIIGVFFCLFFVVLIEVLKPIF
jgi:hypothetical protein